MKIHLGYFFGFHDAKQREKEHWQQTRNGDWKTLEYPIEGHRCDYERTFSDLVAHKKQRQCKQQHSYYLNGLFVLFEE
jgi:hypothetical protein